MSLPPRLSVIVPALNEEDHLRAVVETVRQASAHYRVATELLIVNDGSCDRTGPLADALGDRVIHHDTPRGLGQSYFEGIDAATGEFVVMLPGDDEIEHDSIDRMMSRVGRADILNAYFVNPQTRSAARRSLSRTYRLLVGIASGVFLRYYNGPTVYRRRLVVECPVRTAGYGYNAALVTTLIRHGASVEEIPMKLRALPGRKSRAFRWWNWVSVARSLWQMMLRRFAF